MTHKDAVASASFNLDGSKVLTRCGNSAHIWDLRTPRDAHSIVVRHRGAIQSAVFSPDGLRILTSSVDQSARVWDAETGHPLSERITQPGPANDARFSPDGRWLVIGEGGFRPGPHLASILEVPVANLPIPIWLADLAEAVAGQRLDVREAFQAISPEQLLRIRHDISRSALQDQYTRWAKWFFADDSSRLLSPSSILTMSQSIERHGERNLAALNLPRRDTLTPAGAINLSLYYNISLEGSIDLQLDTNSTPRIQKGPTTLDGTLFDVRGGIRLASTNPAYLHLPYPERVTGIKVFRKCRRLHFLHLVFGSERTGTQVAIYRPHYADGRSWDIPVKYGHDVRTWASAHYGTADPRYNMEATNSTVVWRGTNVVGVPVRLFRTTWENSQTNIEIKSIDFISNMTQSAPILVAITAEP